MKKLFLIIAVVAMFPVLLSASEGDGERRNVRPGTSELRFSVGAVPLHHHIFGVPDTHNKIDEGILIFKDWYTPGFDLEYGYNIKNWLSIGVNFATDVVKKNLFNEEDKSIRIGDGLYTSFTLGVNVRFTYYDRGIVTMYSSVGLGVSGFLSGEKKNGEARDQSFSVFSIPTPDVKLFGVTFGRELYGFADVGYSATGIFRAGIGYRF